MVTEAAAYPIEDTSIQNAHNLQSRTRPMQH